MMHVYFGSDTITARSSGIAFIEECRARGAQIEYINPVEWSPTQLSEMTGSASLFGNEIVFVCDTPSDGEECWDELLTAAPELVQSGNTTVVLEKILLAPVKKKLTVAGVVLYEYVATAKTDTFDVFRLADALLQRDKKNLWLLYTTARLRGVSAEELIGILWWQLKTMRLVMVSKSATEAGLKEFPYNKAKRSLQNFKVGEIDTLAQSLLAVYHDGHGGVRDIDLALEDWVLRV
jgi:DNA polymerase III delta subunit